MSKECIFEARRRLTWFVGGVIRRSGKGRWLVDLVHSAASPAVVVTSVAMAVASSVAMTVASSVDLDVDLGQISLFSYSRRGGKGPCGQRVILLNTVYIIIC